MAQREPNRAGGAAPANQIGQHTGVRSTTQRRVEHRQRAGESHRGGGRDIDRGALERRSALAAEVDHVPRVKDGDVNPPEFRTHPHRLRRDRHMDVAELRSQHRQSVQHRRGGVAHHHPERSLNLSDHQPVARIGGLCAGRDIETRTDAVQVTGRHGTVQHGDR